jgi:protein SCO1
MNARRITTLIALLILAFASGLLLARLIARPEPAPVTERATVLVPPRELPPIELLDADGRPFSNAQFEGGWTLVFFGFARCPDVCPTTLATLAQVQRELGDLAAGQRPRVLLVSVDPERDTPAVLGPYVRHFDPTFLAATGTAEQVRTVATAFGVPYAKVSVGDSGDYTLDHGSALFMVNPQGSLRAVLSAPHSAAVIARDFRAVSGLAAGRR